MSFLSLLLGGLGVDWFLDFGLLFGIANLAILCTYRGYSGLFGFYLNLGMSVPSRLRGSVRFNFFVLRFNFIMLVCVSFYICFCLYLCLDSIYFDCLYLSF